MAEPSPTADYEGTCVECEERPVWDITPWSSMDMCEECHGVFSRRYLDPRPEHRCHCKPGDGTQQCPYEDYCYDEWSRDNYAPTDGSEAGG